MINTAEALPEDECKQIGKQRLEQVFAEGLKPFAQAFEEAEQTQNPRSPNESVRSTRQLGHEGIVIACARAIPLGKAFEYKELFIRDFLKEERDVMHLKRRSDIHQRLYDHIKRVIK